MRHALIATVALLASSSPAVAASFEADLQAGRRWAETKSEGETDGVQMNEVVFAGRYSVLDTGLSVGPTFSYSKFRDADVGDGWNVSNYELGLEAKFAYPVTTWASPYAKARYVGYSRGTMDYKQGGEELEARFRTYGAHLALGAAFNVTKAVQLTAEAGYGVQMMRVTGGEIKKMTDDDGNQIALTSDEKKLPGSNREDFNSKSFMIGMNVSI